MTLPDLIAKLESAMGPSRELDNEIWFALGQPLPDDPVGCPLRYTESLDAALTLVPVDYRLELKGLNSSWFAAINSTRDGPLHEETGYADTAAIALCLACLKARLALEQQHAA